MILMGFMMAGTEMPWRIFKVRVFASLAGHIAVEVDDQGAFDLRCITVDRRLSMKSHRMRACLQCCSEDLWNLVEVLAFEVSAESVGAFLHLIIFRKWITPEGWAGSAHGSGGRGDQTLGSGRLWKGHWTLGTWQGRSWGQGLSESFSHLAVTTPSWFIWFLFSWKSTSCSSLGRSLPLRFCSAQQAVGTVGLSQHRPIDLWARSSQHPWSAKFGSNWNVSWTYWHVVEMWQSIPWVRAQSSSPTFHKKWCDRRAQIAHGTQVIGQLSYAAGGFQ